MVKSRVEGTGVSELRRDLRALADAERAQVLQRFFKTGPGEYGEGDRFLGLCVPQVRALVRKGRDLKLESLLELLRSPWHEERLLALLILVEQYRHGSDAEREAIHRTYLANTRFINNWDLVDASAEHIVGAHVDPQRLEGLEKLAQSSSVWERRIAMMATFHWIKRGLFEPALHIAERLIHDDHDLIHKAVGWMLRELGKRDRSREEEFLRRYYRSMPRVMLRYAIERFPERDRKAYLEQTRTMEDADAGKQ